MEKMLENIYNALKAEERKVALLDIEENLLRILIDAEQKDKYVQVLKKLGWRQQKDISKDLYLYGMDHFLYFEMEDVKLVVCCQLACRSTLNGEWVPLDRKINNYALERVVMEQDTVMPVPVAEDLLCYLLAKCVYTKESFSKEDIARIENCMKQVKEPQLSDKLEGVFFYFTNTILEMVKKGQYDDIVEALWCYSEY